MNAQSRERRLLASRKEARRLCRWIRRRRLPYRTVIRAKLIVHLSKAPGVSAAARHFEMDPKTVRFWRRRFIAEGPEGLSERPRSGRPPTIGPVVRCEVVAMACGQPGDFGVKDRQVWSLDSLLSVFRRRHRSQMSRSSLHRILHRADLRPHRMRVWLHSPDPHFRAKVNRICDLYVNPPPDAVVLSVDEKPGIQARGRRHPGCPALPGRAGRFEFEYIRHGTRTLLAAFDVKTGYVHGKVGPSRSAKDLVEFMESIARRYPRGTVYIIWDNLNIHYDGKTNRWTEFNRRHGGRFRFVYTPLHASWVNQIELFFSILTRRILRSGVFESRVALSRAIRSFLSFWNRHEAHPFNWTFRGYPLQIQQPA